MTVFTVFAFGTGEKSTVTQNIISQFSKACISENLVIEGPDWFGFEVKNNAEKGTQALIEWLKEQKTDDNIINLTGFSRGAVTCIHITNRLKQFERALERRKDNLNEQEKQLLSRLHNVKLHLFALDPVAGMMDKSVTYARIIPENVKSYVATMQMDEMRRDFKPQDITRIIISDPRQTKVSLLPVYGAHSDSVRIRYNDMQSGAKIVWYAMHQFLTQHGTQFKEQKIPAVIAYHTQGGLIELPEHPNTKDLLTLFTQHHQERDNYLKSGQAFHINDGIPIPRIPRTLNNHLKYYVKNSYFFVNQLERELFKLSWPKVFNYLFELNQADTRFPQDSNNNKQAVIADLYLLKQHDPILFKRLYSRGVVYAEDAISLAEPRGFNYLEPCASMQQIFPNLVPESVSEQSFSMSKLADLEMESYRLCFRYQRENPEINFQRQRAQLARAIELRNEINLLVNQSPLDRETKYQMILDTLECHYRYLVLTTSASELNSMLEQLLNKHGRDYQIQKNSTMNALIIRMIKILFRILNESIRFIGSLGYFGGFVLSLIGSELQDLGRRSNELLGNLEHNPLKYIASALAYTLEFLGYIIKTSFGLKELTALTCHAIQLARNTIVMAINSTKIARNENKLTPVPMQSTKNEPDYSRFRLYDHRTQTPDGLASANYAI